MIPKIIHYCWFGKTDKPKIIEDCMKSWKILTDYEIIEWTEEKIEKLDNPFVTQAFKEKKWAFVSDYIRLKALYEYGGIYLDTDVEITKSFNEFLDHDMFVGFITDCSIGTAVIGAKPNHPYIKDLFNSYNNIKWNSDNTTFTLKEYPNVKLKNNNDLFTLYFLNNLDYLKLNNKTQKFETITIYPKEYFEMQPYFGKKYSIHRSIGSWVKPIDDGIRIIKPIRAFIDYLSTLVPIININSFIYHYRDKKALSRKPFYSIYIQHKHEDNTN